MNILSCSSVHYFVIFLYYDFALWIKYTRSLLILYPKRRISDSVLTGLTEVTQYFYIIFNNKLKFAY
jgi:hypothetical protein